ncbi:uridine diphosphate-N-acetylglucosamine-binding protein YvcK [Patescibacteria group bacterium]
MDNRRKKVVTIGGGSGQYVLLSGLRDLANIDITAIVSMVDSGGSTGRLRDEFGVLPPGDILKCMLALSPDRDAARKILQKRFNSGGRLDGHSVGNMLLTILSQYTGSFSEGVLALGEVLNIKGRVLPVTTDKATLVAELTDGSLLYGETVIDVPRGDQREKIKRTYLVPHHSESTDVYPPVIDAIKQADYVIIGPGDIYTSITPNFLVTGVKEALLDTIGEVIFVANIMTKFGETDSFHSTDFITSIEAFIDRKVDKAIFNSAIPEEDILKEYEKQKAKLVEANIGSPWEERTIIKEDMLNTAGDMARHDSKKLAKLIEKLINT